MKKLKIMVTDDHPFFRDGMRQMLIESELFSVVDEASNGMEALEKLRENKYDLVIMDIKMPVMNGIEATREIKSRYPDVKVLAMSMFDEQPYIVKMLKAGAKGYLLKNSGKEELLNAISKISGRETYFSKDVTNTMMSHIIEGRPLQAADDEPVNVSLTRREKEIIRRIAEEQTNVEIGEALGISPRTVDTHRRNLLQKLKVKNTAGIVRFAMIYNLKD
jgi:DNA-binding NarL/FixJ family response regulator